jgi:DNA-binding transcriptional ArsR family regulator
MQVNLDQAFSAFANPTRRAILARLAQGESNVSELAQPFLTQMSLPAITKHIKVLEDAGLIIKGHDKQCRPCRLNPPAMKEAADWIETYRVYWEESFDRLDAYLKTVTAKNHEGKDNGDKRK